MLSRPEWVVPMASPNVTVMLHAGAGCLCASTPRERDGSSRDSAYVPCLPIHPQERGAGLGKGVVKSVLIGHVPDRGGRTTDMRPSRADINPYGSRGGEGKGMAGFGGTWRIWSTGSNGVRGDEGGGLCFWRMEDMELL